MALTDTFVNYSIELPDLPENREETIGIGKRRSLEIFKNCFRGHVGSCFLNRTFPSISYLTEWGSF